MLNGSVETSSDGLPVLAAGLGREILPWSEFLHYSCAGTGTQVVEKCQQQDISADPNQTVQAFIDLCQRHEHNFYKFVHEVHCHDNGLFDQLIGWIEGILQFLREGPKGGKLDMNALFAGAISVNRIDQEKAIEEINHLIAWQEAHKKMAPEQNMSEDGRGGRYQFKRIY